MDLSSADAELVDALVKVVGQEATQVEAQLRQQANACHALGVRRSVRSPQFAQPLKHGNALVVLVEVNQRGRHPVSLSGAQRDKSTSPALEGIAK